MQKPQHKTTNDKASFVMSFVIMPKRLSRVNVIECGLKSGEMTEITKSDVAEILDNVFAKYGIELVEDEPVQKVIKKTSAKSKKSTAKKSKASSADEYVIDGEKFTLNGVFTTKGSTYKKQVSGGVKLTTMVVQVTQSQKDAWDAWRKA